LGYLIWNIYYFDGEVPHASKDKRSFWWRDVLRLVDWFRGIAKCKVGDETTVLFWEDIRNDHLLQQKFPILYSFAKNKQVSVVQFLVNNDIDSQFHVLLSDQAFQEYQQLQQLLQHNQTTVDQKDSWHYIWGNSIYTSSKFYHLPYKNVHPPKAFIWIWDSSCANKIKVFAWLLLMDRLNVRNILRRKKHKLQRNDYSCVMCTNQCEETTFHLFFSCPFSRAC
jgi:hypothetical protein